MTAIHIRKWLVCPTCESQNVKEPLQPSPGQNRYFECPDCGQEGMVVG